MLLERGGHLSPSSVLMTTQPTLCLILICTMWNKGGHLQLRNQRWAAVCQALEGSLRTLLTREVRVLTLILQMWEPEAQRR
jgi:hypothetical protein